MDEGYLSQGHYSKQRAKIVIEEKGKKDAFTYKDYSWTDHISRKWGQWLADPLLSWWRNWHLAGLPLRFQRKNNSLDRHASPLPNHTSAK